MDTSKVRRELVNRPSWPSSIRVVESRTAQPIRGIKLRLAEGCACRTSMIFRALQAVFRPSVRRQASPDAQFADLCVILSRKVLQTSVDREVKGMNTRIMARSVLVFVALCGIASVASLFPARTARADAYSECLFWADVMRQQCQLNCATQGNWPTCWPGCDYQHAQFHQNVCLPMLGQ